LAEIVDDDRQEVGPVPVPVADGRVAGSRHLVGARSDDRVPPALGPAAEHHPQRRTVEVALTAAARAADAVPSPAVLVGPRLERGPRAVAAIDQAVASESV